jgi:L-alanine-DL-glutamate epimerase-like enolase superfamily enzyme
MSLYDRIRDLPLVVETCELEGLAHSVSTGFTRRTTVVRLRGGGEEGVGEDVTYEEAHHLGLRPPPGLAGEHTLDSLSAHVAGAPGYARWALESAALDLALRQAGVALADALGREARPVTFVVSTRSGVREWLDLYPGLGLKLDAEADWTDELMAGLAATGAVKTTDLKGFYRGTPVDLLPDAGLYRRVCEAFPSAWIEDAAITDETRAVLEPHRERLTWDAPIHSVEDVEALEWRPRCVNSKPSRFGSLRNLLDFYDYCEASAIQVYGGGQFELGPGRGHIQHLASLFHPDMPNDVAPREYNLGGPRGGLPTSPLGVAAHPAGLGWGD